MRRHILRLADIHHAVALKLYGAPYEPKRSHPGRNIGKTGVNTARKIENVGIVGHQQPVDAGSGHGLMKAVDTQRGFLARKKHKRFVHNLTIRYATAAP